jgi:hypothetical protein
LRPGLGWLPAESMMSRICSIITMGMEVVILVLHQCIQIVIEVVTHTHIWRRS